MCCKQHHYTIPSIVDMSHYSNMVGILASYDSFPFCVQLDHVAVICRGSDCDITPLVSGDEQNVTGLGVRKLACM